jgi:hypothetical protein
VIEPNNFSPPAFAVILISIALKLSANACASLTTLASVLFFGFQLTLSLQKKLPNVLSLCKKVTTITIFYSYYIIFKSLNFERLF